MMKTKKPKYNGVPKVSEVVIEEIQFNPDDLAEGERTIRHNEITTTGTRKA